MVCTSSGDWRVARDFKNLPAWIVKAVGGTSIHWAGASLRFQDHEWKALTTYGRVDGASLLDWPIDAAEMAPWYDKAEAKLGVTGVGPLTLPGVHDVRQRIGKRQRRLLRKGIEQLRGNGPGMGAPVDANPAADDPALRALRIG